MIHSLQTSLLVVSNCFDLDGFHLFQDAVGKLGAEPVFVSVSGRIVDGIILGVSEFHINLLFHLELLYLIQTVTEVDVKY